MVIFKKVNCVAQSVTNMVVSALPQNRDGFRRNTLGTGSAAKLKVEKGPVISAEEAERFEAAMKRYAATEKGSEERLKTFAETLPIFLRGYNAKAKDTGLTDDERTLLTHIGRYIQIMTREIDDALVSANRETRRLALRVYAEAGATKKIVAIAKDHTYEEVSLDAVGLILDQLRRLVLEGGKAETRVLLKSYLVEIGVVGTYAAVRDKVIDYFVFGQKPVRPGTFVIAPDGKEIMEQREDNLTTADRTHLLEIARRVTFPDTKRRLFAVLRDVDDETALLDSLASRDIPALIEMLCPGYEQKRKPEPDPPPSGAVVLPLPASRDLDPPKRLYPLRKDGKSQEYQAAT